MNKKQITAMKKHRNLAIGISIVIGTLWLMLVMYTLSADRAPKTEINPGAISASSMKQHAEESKTTTPTVKAPRVAPSSRIQHHVVTTPNVNDDAPKATMHSTSMHLRQTSDATAHNVGSGIATATYAATTSNGRSQKGVSYSGLGFGGNMFMLSSSLALASPGARQANDLTSVRGPQGRNGMKQTDGPPPGPFPDPIGDVAWGLMLFLTIAYATMLGVRRFRREER